jgi:hypothetical protein
MGCRSCASTLTRSNASKSASSRDIRLSLGTRPGWAAISPVAKPFESS